MTRAAAVTFDFGQTLAELDPALLVEKLAGLGATARVEDIEAALPGAWRRYDEEVRAHVDHPWKALMTALCEGAGVAPRERLAELVDALWLDQPRRNLWQRPIPGMIALVSELRARGVPVAVVSNSEGKLAELVALLGWTEIVGPVLDSGVLGYAKPDPRMFRRAAEVLGVPLEAIVHVGDSHAADVAGARAAGCRAIWFAPLVTDAAADGERPLQEAEELRQALAQLHLL